MSVLDVEVVVYIFGYSSLHRICMVSVIVSNCSEELGSLARLPRYESVRLCGVGIAKEWELSG